MIGYMIILWSVAGISLGVVHACGILHASQRPSAWSAIIGVLRLGGVGLLLVAAALLGGILPAAGGWTLGFFAAIVATLFFQKLGTAPQKG